MSQVIVWTISDIIALSVAVLFFVIYAAANLITCIHQSRCKHEKYRETRSCDAICSCCGKNLGFIGNVRDKAKS